MLRADALVVAVEEHAKGRVVRQEAGLEVRLKTLQTKGLEEPGGVRQVPLGGAGVGHALGLAVGFRQWRDELHRGSANLGIAPCQRRDRDSGSLQGGHGFILSRESWVDLYRPQLTKCR